MYKLKDDIIISFNSTQKEVANEIGISEETLSRIINKKQECSKIIAYCIVKHIDKNKEIKDYFVRER